VASEARGGTPRLEMSGSGNEVTQQWEWDTLVAAIARSIDETELRDARRTSEAVVRRRSDVILQIWGSPTPIDDETE
jgi:hypothetical protein